MDQTSSRRNVFLLMAMYFMMQMALTPQFGYLSLFYQSRGMTAGEISLLFGVAPFISVIGQYIFSNIADKAKNVNIVLGLVAVLTFVTVPMFLLSNSFVIMLPVACLYNIFSTSMTPLIDSTCIYYSAAHNYPFGRIRLMGSLGYMCCMLIAGFIADIHIDYIFYLQMGLGVIFLLTIPASPKVTMPKMKKAAFNPMVMLRKPSVLLSMILAAPIFVSFGFNMTFYGTYVTGELGMNSSFIGLSSVVSIAIEVTFLLFMDRMVRRIPIKALMFGIAALVVARWLVYGLSDDPMWVLIFFGIEGITSVATYFFISYYFKRIAPPEGKVSTQTLASIFCYCICKGVGSLIGSTVIDMMGSQQNAYLFFAAVVGAATLIFVLTPIKFQAEES